MIGAFQSANLENRHDQIEISEVEAAMKDGALCTGASLVLATACAAIVWRDISRPTIAIWLLLFLIHVTLYTVARHFYWRDAYRKEKKQNRVWRLFLILATCFHGSILGSVGFLALPEIGHENQIWLTVIILFFSAAAAAHLASLLAPVLVLVSISQLPLAVKWWYAADNAIVSGALLAFWLLNLYICCNQYRSLWKAWRLLARNRDLAAELDQKNLALRQAADARAKLIGMASHDLRHPVHSMGIILQRLNENEPGNLQKQELGLLRDLNRMLSEMLHELMDYSILERTEYSVVPCAVSLEPIFAQIRTSLGLTASRKGLKLVIPSGDGFTVWSDAKLLRRVLLNLLSNAIKYTEKGGISIDCSLNNGVVLLRIRDTGIGLTPEQHCKIFVDDIRLKNSGDDDTGAVGLGLSIVKLATDLLGHRISVDSELGKGTTFELCMVATESNAAQTSPDVEHAPAGTSIGEVILLIENDVYVREMLESILRKCGFRPFCAQTAEVALANMIRQGLQGPDLIIADLHLDTSRDGLQTIEMIRQATNRHELPALLMTGDVSPAVVALAAASNVVVRIKPFSPVQLIDDISALIVRQRADTEQITGGAERNFAEVDCTYGVLDRHRAGNPLEVRSLAAVVPTGIRLRQQPLLFGGRDHAGILLESGAGRCIPSTGDLSSQSI